MSTNTKIAWTDASWNPVVGCTKVSAGCKNCYAERMAGRLACMKQRKYQKVISSDDLKWNGKTYCDESALEKPLHWKNPRRIFVCSMGDLFHESVPFEFIAKVYYQISICYWHTFQILTKRPERVLEFYEWIKQQQKGLWWGEFGVLAKHLPMDEDEGISEPYLTYHTKAKAHYYPDIPEPVDKLGDAGIFVPWPLPNLWLGVTAENQEQWLLRKEAFFDTPAAVHFVSNEPLLGAIKYSDDDLKRLDQVIIGCESGPGKRELHIEHIYNLVEQCKDAGTPVFVKQIHKSYKATKNRYSFYLEKNIKNFPKPLQVQEYPKQ